MSKYRDLSKISELIIHCAATPNGKPFSARDIDRWHRERGFRRSALACKFHAPHLQHIGYHFVIDLSGIVVAGRALTETGAHARGFNGVSVGICLIGTDAFTCEQWLSLKQLVQSLQNRLPDTAVLGHRQSNAHKTCPGFDVPDWLRGDMTAMPEHLILLTEELA